MERVDGETLPAVKIDRERTAAKMRVFGFDVAATDFATFPDEDIVCVVDMAAQKIGCDPKSILSFEEEGAV